MFIPKCSFLPFLKDKLDEDVGRVFHRVIVDDPISFEEEMQKLDQEDDLSILDE